MLSKLKKALMLSAFGLIITSTVSLQVSAMDKATWTDEQFYCLDDGDTILHKAVCKEAVWNKNKQLIKQILADQRANHNFINTKSTRAGKTALHLAAQKQNENTCRLLIKAGADRTIIDDYDNIALSYLSDYAARARLNAL